MNSFAQTGGARLDSINVRHPLAILTGDANALHLQCMGREYHFPRNRIRRLRLHQGLFSSGLRIEHGEDALPQFVVFWASIFFWTSGFRNLKMQLRKLGYEIVA